MIVVIPAYQPDEKLKKLVRELKEQTDYTVIVVDDGSSKACTPLFDALESSAIVLRQHPNKGKGAAMKMAFAYAAEHFPSDEGIVTADADGQHLIADIVRVSEEWKAFPETLVTGGRRFTGNVPWRSRAGNAITRFVFSVSTGVKVYDTQTGLRAFAVNRVPAMLKLKGNRYEYEINQLLYCTRHRIPIREVGIETVYIQDNASSHYRALIDSARIYKVIGLFVSSSVICFFFEYALTLTLSHVIGSRSQLAPAMILFLSTILPRVLSAALNYLLNLKVVFKSHNKTSFPRYALVALVVYGVYYVLMHGLTISLLPVPKFIAIVLAQLMCYPLNFYLQRRFVFAERKP